MHGGKKERRNEKGIVALTIFVSPFTKLFGEGKWVIVAVDVAGGVIVAVVVHLSAPHSLRIEI